jgi:hypothetical protein
MQNGKGDRPRNNFSKEFWQNYDQIQFNDNIVCDHIHNGNLCCPCGKNVNRDVKYVFNNGAYRFPYGKKGIVFSEAKDRLEKELGDKIAEILLVKLAWERQMITGEVYFELCRKHGGGRYIEQEKML